ncbi:hypothetical protein MNV49_007176 [Pseudohyphozyma bogoriensis]|nr:hypothetical protein MNV49_007176 [Pseudohyphozyma bogoriensis]
MTTRVNRSRVRPQTLRGGDGGLNVWLEQHSPDPTRTTFSSPSAQPFVSFPASDPSPNHTPSPQFPPTSASSPTPLFANSSPKATPPAPPPAEYKPRLQWRDSKVFPKPPMVRRREQQVDVWIRRVVMGVLVVCVIIVGGVYYSQGAPPPVHDENPMQTRLEKALAKQTGVLSAFKSKSPSFRDSLVASQRYIISPQHGGFAHTTMGLYHLTYLSTILGRTPLVPPFTFDSHHHSSSSSKHPTPAPLAISNVYDVERFRNAVNVSMVDWKDIQPLEEEDMKRKEPLGCWVAQMPLEELTERSEGLNELGLDPSFYTLRIGGPRGSAGQQLNDLQIAYAFLSGFDADPAAQAGLIDQALHTSSAVTLSKNNHHDPEQHVFCVDHSLFHTTSSSRASSHAHLDQYEHTAFKAHGVALRFVPELDDVANDVISFVLGEKQPFVGAHISASGECFKGNKDASGCIRQLLRYVEAVDRVRALSAKRHGGNHGMKKTREHRHSARTLPVIVTTDVTDIGFLGEIVNLGWTLLDYNDLEVRQHFGTWPREVIESVVQSKASGFVGTKDCPESTLDALRVRAWKNGAVELL